jgi:hypothetical protein
MKIIKIRSQKLLLLSPIAQGDNHLKPDSSIFFIYSSLPSEINSHLVLLFLESLQHFFAYALKGFRPIVLINNLPKLMYSNDLNCSISPSFITLICSTLKINLKHFYISPTFQIIEIASMLDKCSPVIVVEPATPIKLKIAKMVPIVETDQLLQLNSFFMLDKT